MISNGTYDMITPTTYDNMWRTNKSYKPYEINLGSNMHKFDVSFNSNDISYYSSSYPYSWNEYMLDGSGKIKNVHPSGDVYQSNHYLHYAYGSNSISDSIFSYSTNSLYKTTVYNENNDYNNQSGYKYKHLEFRDKLGNLVQTIQDWGGLKLRTRFEYDVLGNVVGVGSPDSHPSESHDSKSLTLHYPSTSGNLDIYISPGAGDRTVQFLLSASSGLNRSMKSGGIQPLSLLGSTVHYYIIQYQNGTMINQSQQYTLYCAGDQNILSDAYTILSSADHVKLSIVSVSYPSNDTGNWVSFTFNYSSFINDFADQYVYNTLSQLTKKVTPDAGTTDYLYDQNGNLRFIKDANHRNQTINNLNEEKRDINWNSSKWLFYTY